MAAKKSGKGGGGSGQKSGPFTRDGIEKLVADKPVVYKLLGHKGGNRYTGVAKRGRVKERLLEHLPGAKDPVRGAKRVELLPKKSIQDAEKSESRIIARDKPPGNKQGTKPGPKRRR